MLKNVILDYTTVIQMLSVPTRLEALAVNANQGMRGMDYRVKVYKPGINGISLCESNTCSVRLSTDWK